MNMASLKKRIKRDGPVKAAGHYAERVVSAVEEKIPKSKVKYRILLLTNRDSDNVGDQIIEACDISLISAVMKNLGIKSGSFEIKGCEAAIITKKYLATRDKTLLKTIDGLVEESDMVIFGGAPIFNYIYQDFYERTAVILEIAKKYDTPVIISSIGVEGYDEENRMCQRLKETINFDCVKMITTRDDFDSLQRYMENRKILIGKVSDPAVFSSKIFENYVPLPKKRKKKRVGIFVLRANGFIDNRVNFTREEAVALWKGIIDELESRGYDYEVMTSGHFGDEAFLDYLIRQYDFDMDKCVFNMNVPEKLIDRIASCDAVISCRLHPSLISYSLDVPAVGIVWNPKVRSFYESIGYEDRAIDVRGIDPVQVVDKIEEILPQRLQKDKTYLISVYQYLFRAMKKILYPDGSPVKPYTYAELMKNLPLYRGTPEKEKDGKIRRKFRRTYGKYNELFEKNVQNRTIISRLTAEHVGYEIVYYSGTESNICCEYDETMGSIWFLRTGAIEYRPKTPVKNDGSFQLEKNRFVHPGFRFSGWRMRFKNNNVWYWYLEDQTYHPLLDYVEGEDKDYYIFQEEGILPRIEEDYVTTVIVEAIWEPEQEADRKING